MTQSGARTPWHVRRTEAYKAGMEMPAAASERARLVGAAMQLLADHERLQAAIRRVLTEWPESCEYHLVTRGLEPPGRAEWLCRAACFLDADAPENCSRIAWQQWLTPYHQTAARKIALDAIAAWRERDNGAETPTLF